MGAANRLSTQSGLAATAEEAGAYFRQSLSLIVPQQDVAVRRGRIPQRDGVESSLPEVGTDGVDRHAQRGGVDRSC